MNTALYDRGDRKTANELHLKLAKIVRSAFGGEAKTVYGFFKRLESGKSLNPNDPVFTFPFTRKATYLNANISVTAELYPFETGLNRVLGFRICIRDVTFLLNAALKFEAAEEADSWIALDLPNGFCSDQALARTGLAAIIAAEPQLKWE